jgi:hypothetical protein
MTEVRQSTASSAAVAGTNTDLAKTLAKSPSRKAAATDDRLESEQSKAELHAQIPVVAAISAVRRVTPFLFFMQVYADAMYPSTANRGLRVAKFRAKNPKLFWFHWCLDLVVQLVLIGGLLGLGVVVLFNGLRETFG